MGLTINNNIRICIVQDTIVWMNPQENITHFRGIIQSVSGKADVVVLPEMFTTGFSKLAISHALSTGDSIYQELIFLSKETNLVITGSVAFNNGNEVYNRLFWIQPDGKVISYDKKHLFRFAGEHEHYKPGKEKVIIEWRGWKFRPLICFDLRFPVWSRNICNSKHEHQTSMDYDVLIYVANWPDVRSRAWKILLEARAHENQCYVIGVNRVGTDGHCMNYSGDSVVISPKGEILASVAPNQSGFVICSLSKGDLQEYREKFPVALEQDEFRII